MRPIWDYQSKLRTNNNTRNIAIEKTDGAERQGLNDMMKRWGEWTAECFRKHNDQLKPRIENIHDIEWGKEEMQVKEDLQTIRPQAALTKIIQEEPERRHGSTKNMPNKTLTKN